MRIFKTKWFAREASSHGISDDELYQVRFRAKWLI